MLAVGDRLKRAAPKTPTPARKAASSAGPSDAETPPDKSTAATRGQLPAGDGAVVKARKPPTTAAREPAPAKDANGVD